MLGVVETFVVTHRHSRSLEFTPLSRPNIIVMHCNYVSKLYFSEIFSTSNEWYAIHIWDESFKVIENGTIRQIMYTTPTCLYCKYCCIPYHFRVI